MNRRSQLILGSLFTLIPFLYAEENSSEHQLLNVPALSAPVMGNRLEISPTTFDFGWCPDNSKISATFVAKNVSSEMIPIMSVQPTCGCTASQFSPATLGTHEETKIGLTFNTRGYTNLAFNKSAKVKSDVVTGEFSVNLKGYVLDPNAKVVPVGDGVIEFTEKENEKKKTIKIENKSDKEITLVVIHDAADWAKLKLSNEKISAGKSVSLSVVASGSLADARDTSVTYAAMADSEVNRLTIAIRTGPPPVPYRQITPPPSGRPQETPAPPPSK